MQKNCVASKKSIEFVFFTRTNNMLNLYILKLLYIGFTKNLLSICCNYHIYFVYCIYEINVLVDRSFFESILK